MLNFLKSKSSKIVISSLLILGFLASLNFKFDFLGSSKKISGNGKIIAKVADIEISEGDLENVVANFKNEMMNQDQNNIMNLSDADEELLRKNILSGIINEKLFLKFIEKLDLNLDDNIVIEEIKKTPQFNNDAGMFDQNKFQEFLKSISMTERKYIDEVKKNIILYYGFFKIFNRNLIQIPEREEVFLKNLSRIRTVDILQMNFGNFSSNFKSNIQISDQSIQDFYKSNQNLYSEPEYRSIKYSIIKLSDIKNNIKIDENFLKEKITEKLNSNDIKSSDLRSVDNIICETDNDAKKIIEILSKIKLSEYKEKNTNDLNKIFKDENGLDCLILDAKDKQKENFPSNFSEIIFNELKLDDSNYFSKNIVESNLGKHVLILKNIRKISENDLIDSTKRELENEISNNEFKEKIQKIRSEISNLNQKDRNNENINEIEKKFDLKFKNKNFFDISGNFLSENDQINEINGLKKNNLDLILDQNLLQNIFSSEKNSINLFQINDDEYLIYEISDIKEKSIKNLEESYEDIKNNLIQQEVLKNFSGKILEILEDLKSEKKQVEEILASNPWIKEKKNVEIFNPFLLQMKINIKNPQDIPFALMNQISNNNEKIIGPIEIEEDAFIAIEKETRYQEIPSEQKEKILKAIQYSISSNESNEIINSITESLKKRYKIQDFSEKN